MRTLNQLKLSLADRSTLLAAIGILRAECSVEQIILFGSKARGDDHPDSDIDLLILTSRSLTWEEKAKLREPLHDLEYERGVTIGTLIISSTDWYQGIYQAHPLRDEIDRDGVAA